MTHIHEREASVFSCPKGLRKSLKVPSFLLLQWVPNLYSSHSLSHCHTNMILSHISLEGHFLLSLGWDVVSAHKDVLHCLPSHVMDRQVFLLFSQALFISVPLQSQSDKFWDWFWQLAREGKKPQPCLLDSFFGYRMKPTQ